jgi:4-hydroxybenzoate polyprenyltransferase
MRISNWSKAGFVLLGVVYARAPNLGLTALLAALAFCLISSAVYIYNDLKDINEDYAHPQKCRRPLASGIISSNFAYVTLAICLCVGNALAFFISAQLLLILFIYLLINIIYNHWVREIAILDVTCIASGFMLRILAGTIGIGLPITCWLTVAATLLCLFIALCKRRLEIRLSGQATKRSVLKKYTPKLLDRLIYLSAAGSYITYLLYTFHIQHGHYFFILTLPCAAFGLWRFTYLATKKSAFDDPVTVFLEDRGSVVNVLVFLLLTLLALFQ